MIAIICQKGIIDATRCRLHIIERGISQGPDQPDINEGYDLVLTHLDSKVETVISTFSVKRQAKFTYQHIINAINEGKPSVDITEHEKMKSEIGYL